MQHHYKYFALGILVGITSCGSPSSNNSTNPSTASKKVEIPQSQMENQRGESLVGKNIEKKNLENTNIITEEDPIQAVLNDPSIKVEYAPEDNFVLSQDTTLNFGQEKLDLSFTTTCMNDKSVLQEFFVFDKGNPRNSYLITHNYQTEFLLKNKDGQIITQKVIKKEFFRDFVDKDFLKRSIIKHPDFVDYDARKQEATFNFFIGIPHTDLIALATLKINSLGQLKIEKVENVSL